MGNLFSRISRGSRRSRSRRHLRHTTSRHDPVEFKPVMKFIRPDGRRNRIATALLDTQCPAGIWIAQRLVNEMGMSTSVSPCPSPPTFRDANGNSFTACGVIELSWMWQDPPGTRIHNSRFLVFSTDLDREVDVIVGRDLIQSLRLVGLRRENFLVLVQHKKPEVKEEQAAVTSAQEKQREEKVALVKRRRKKHGEKESQGQQRQTY